MKKKICPVCERELTAAGYCRLCRKLVLKPIVRDVDYYLNETRPDNQTLLNQKRIGEGNCLEGEEKPDLREKMAGYYEKARKQAESLQKDFQKEKKLSGANPGRQTKSREEKKKQSYGQKQDVFRSAKGVKVRVKTDGIYGKDGKKRTLPVIIAIILCIVLINVLSGLVDVFVDHFAQERHEDAEYELVSAENTSADVSGQEYGYSVTELDEEEVKASGVRCSGEDHFACGITDMDRRLNEVFSELDLQAEKGEYTDNYVIYSGEDAYEFYDTCIYYSIPDESGAECLSVLLDGDTVTGEVHRVTVGAAASKDSETAAEILKQMADAAAGTGDTVTKEEVMAALTSGDGLIRPAHNYMIYGYDYEGISGVLIPCQDWDEEDGGETI